MLYSSYKAAAFCECFGDNHRVLKNSNVDCVVLHEHVVWINVYPHLLTHWGRVTHICIGNLTSIGSDNGLSPGRRQVIIGTNAGILLIKPLGTIFSEILIEIHAFSFKKMHLKMSSGKRRPFCLGLHVLMWSNIRAFIHKFVSIMTNRILSVFCKTLNNPIMRQFSLCCCEMIYVRINKVNAIDSTNK